MRIIAGECRGVKLATLPGQATRPTLERVKEGLFSAIQPWLPGAAVLELYAGSGQLGLEALSRGGAFCTFVESGKEAAALIRQNAQTAGLSPRCRVLQTMAETFVAGCKQQFDIILLDPPFESAALPGLLPPLGALCRPGALVLCETGVGQTLPEEAGGLQLQKQYRYGSVRLWRYRMPGEEAPPR